jgi:hypothetical protein
MSIQTSIQATMSMQKTIKRIAIRKLSLDREFAKFTRLVNNALDKFNLHICKDCQKLTIPNEDRLWRCAECQTEHDQYIREKVECDLRDEYCAEQEAYENDRD